MSFTRFRYDNAREEKRQQESSDPGRWVLNVPGNGDEPAFIEDPHIRLQSWGANLAGNSLAIEDDLRGMTRNLNRDNIDKDYKTHSTPHMQSVYTSNDKLTVGQTRATHPAWMVRTAQPPRWEVPLSDPQNHTEMLFLNNIGSRMGEKDAYGSK